MVLTSEEIVERQRKAASERSARAAERAELASRQPPPEESGEPEEKLETVTTETYLTADDVKLKYSKSILWLVQKQRTGQVKSGVFKGMTKYSESDVINQLESDLDKAATADAIRSATSLVKQTQEAMGQMFQMTFKAQESLLSLMQKNTAESHQQVIELETSIREMRQITDKANTEESARQVMREESAQRIVMQQRAFQSLQTVLLPYVQKKMGLTPPSSPPTNGTAKPIEPGINPDQKTMLADGIISWFQTLPPESVAKMKENLPAEHAASFAQIADLLKGNEVP